jgi:hypothetical protein
MGKCSIQVAVRLGLALLVGLLAFAGPAAAADPPVALSAHLTGDETRTRFTAELSYPVSYSVYVLSNPYRVMIDLPEVNFQFPDGLGTGTLLASLLPTVTAPSKPDGRASSSRPTDRH